MYLVQKDINSFTKLVPPICEVISDPLAMVSSILKSLISVMRLEFTKLFNGRIVYTRRRILPSQGGEASSNLAAATILQDRHVI